MFTSFVVRGIVCSIDLTMFISLRRSLRISVLRPLVRLARYVLKAFVTCMAPSVKLPHALVILITSKTPALKAMVVGKAGGTGQQPPPVLRRSVDIM